MPTPPEKRAAGDIEWNGSYGSDGNYGSNGNREMTGNQDTGPDRGGGAASPSHNSHDSHISHTSHSSHPSHNSHSPHPAPHPFLPRPRDYHTLFSYQKSEVTYEITYRFCHRFLARGDRTIDQMIQAARSGKQNIVEGSKAATTSKEMEIKLTNVARASLEELLEDFLDFLRVRDLRLWDRQSREALYVRKLATASPLTFEPFREFTETRPAEVIANIAICLIHQANYLLDQQIKGLERTFLQDGGLREQMTRARLQARNRR